MSTTADLPENDSALFELIQQELYTPVVGDCLDAFGRNHQFLSPEIRGVTATSVVLGRAMPVLITDVFGPQKKPFGRLTEALDQLQPLEVYIARNGGELPTAAWGEILTATAIARGASGAVIDGFHRDTTKVLAQNWPVFSRGSFAQDAAIRKAVVDYRVSIEVGGVRVEPGDLIFGDVDGVVVIPRAMEYDVLSAALAKVRGESLVRSAIQSGMTSTEAFQKYGIL